MKSKTIIKLVYLVCWFIVETFINKDQGVSKLALHEIRDLTDE